MRTEILLIVVVALTWGGYPLLARASGVGTPLGALILTTFALVPIGMATLWNGVASRPPTQDVVRLGIAGVLMGTGTAAFNYIVNSRALDASISIPIVDTAMLIVSVVCAIVFFAEPITVRKAIGIALLVAGIVVLKPE